MFPMHSSGVTMSGAGLTPADSGAYSQHNVHKSPGSGSEGGGVCLSDHERAGSPGKFRQLVSISAELLI